MPLANMDGTSQNKKSKKEADASEQQADRTTRMLLAVLLLFLITELPQAILGILSAALGEDFDTQCYRPLGKAYFVILILITIFQIKTATTTSGDKYLSILLVS